jgi:lipoate-protein ligase B
MPIPCLLLNLDFIKYEDALSLMRDLVAARITGFDREVLFLLEHEPVITLGRRGSFSDILLDESGLNEQGVGVHRVERGGLATYHGPGQLVTYPIFNLNRFRLSVPDLVRRLEEAAIQCLGEYGITAGLREGHPGVFYNGKKLASVGLSIKSGISMHGLSFNVDPNLDHFALINPCGLTGSDITSLSRLKAQVSDSPVNKDEVRQTFLSALIRVFDLEIEPWSLDAAKQVVKEYGQTSAQAEMA